MKIVIAIDSFKGSLSSIEAGEAVKEAALSLDKTAEIIVRPLADGGEGTVDAMAETGRIETVTVSGPLEKRVEAKYAITADNTAVIEMSAAAGITLISPKERNPMKTTTYGVGEIIRDAIEKGCRNFIVGIGGSATNDGGIGMLSALGYEFLDKGGKPVGINGAALEKVAEIKTENVIPELSNCTFNIACDVSNTLCGEKGCSAVYGPQKGATPEDIEKMDRWLNAYADIAATVSKTADKFGAGVGAAGGLGFAFLSFTNATLKSGIDIILEQTNLENYIKDADIVVTGEGRLDSQTVMGKAPIGVAKLAKKHGKRVIAFSGCVTEDAEVINDHGIDAFFPILRGVVSLEEALYKENARANLTATAKQVFRLLIK